MKKILLFLLVCVLALGFAGCADKRIEANRPPTDQVEGGGKEDGTEKPGDKDDDFSVSDTVVLYSCTFRAKAAKKEASLRAVSSAAYLKEGDTFYIDVTLIDLEDTVDFIYTVVINGIKYRNSDGVLGNTERDREEKTVTFSVELVYDGVTDMYGIDDIVIMSNLSVRYYVTIADEYKPVVLPTRTGDGTAENPYLIYNAEMLLDMIEYPAGTYFRQANDIDLSTVDTGEKYQNGENVPLDRWKPIGTTAYPFRSHFDGNGFKIFRLSIQRFDLSYQSEGVGLFGYAENCEFKNVTLEDYRVEVRYARTVGALVGFAQNCVVTDCKLVQGRKENFESGSWSFSNMGGLVGFANQSYIEGCSVTSDLGLFGESPTVYPRVGMLGGVVGELRRSVMLNCKFSGKIESGIVAGGVVGRCDEAVIAGCESDANIYSALIAGGIVGQLWRSNLMMSAFSGVISFPERADMPIGEYTYFGGIVGDAGVEYGSYSDLLDGVMTKSEIRGCKFSGEIRNESYMGDLYRALAGGICARLYDCEISDAEVCGAFIIADSAFALAALNGGGEGWIEGSVVGDVDLEAMSGMGSVADGVVCHNVYVDSESYFADGSDAVAIVDWQAQAENIQLSDAWSRGSGRPTLLYAGILPDEILQQIKDMMPPV